jgi:hypothetical protein
MRSIASVYLVPVAALPAVAEAVAQAGTRAEVRAEARAAGLLEALDRYGREIEDAYFWSGENLLLVIQYLWRANGISLFSTAYQRFERALNPDDQTGAVLIMGAEHKPLLPRIDPSNHDMSGLTKALAAWGVPPAEARLAATDALALLHEQLAALPEEAVLVIHVG